MTQQTILSLDTATTTGWALCKNGKITFGHWKFTQHNRNMKLESTLEEMIQQHSIDIIVAEDVYKASGKGKAYEILCGLRGNIEAVSQRNSIPVIYVEPLQARKELFKTEYRNRNFDIYKITKEDIQSKIKARYKHDTKLHDEADALTQLYYYFKHMDRYRLNKA